MSIEGWRWAVSYETATIARGISATRDEAEHMAIVEHDYEVLAGTNPDKLAWHVSKVEHKTTDDVADERRQAERDDDEARDAASEEAR